MGRLPLQAVIASPMAGEIEAGLTDEQERNDAQRTFSQAYR